MLDADAFGYFTDSDTVEAMAGEKLQGFFDDPLPGRDSAILGFSFPSRFRLQPACLRP
ncbi:MULTISPECIES: hypothetical protein [Sphingopyxis]|uniref:hypothetical protein n=1 Tax=Sphingopyxis TaxID=165697 RepID=UPI001FB37D9C|nr:MULTISPECIES: hypothetical protein [Sphingopyxis]